MLDVAIIGTGPAGYMTVVRLHDKGFHTELYEAAPGLGPQGVGIPIKPYGTKEVAEHIGYDHEQRFVTSRDLPDDAA